MNCKRERQQEKIIRKNTAGIKIGKYERNYDMKRKPKKGHERQKGFHMR